MFGVWFKKVSIYLQRRMGCPNAVPMLRLPTGSLAAPVIVWWTQLGARAATADLRCCCLRDSLAACKHVGFVSNDPGAHGMNRWQTKQTERGKLMRRAVGMAKAKWQANKKPAEQSTASKHSRRILRPAQALKKQPADGRLCSKQQQPQTMSACLSPCREVGEYSGAGSQEGGCRPT